MSDTKYVPIKARIEVNVPTGAKSENGEAITKKEHYTVLWLCLYLINTEPKFNQDGAGIRMSSRIETAVLKAEETEADYLPLRAEDYDVLRELAEKPTHGYAITPARKVMPLLDDLCSAVNEIPAQAARPLPTEANGAAAQA